MCYKKLPLTQKYTISHCMLAYQQHRSALGPRVRLVRLAQEAKEKTAKERDGAGDHQNDQQLPIEGHCLRHMFFLPFVENFIKFFVSFVLEAQGEVPQAVS